MKPSSDGQADTHYHHLHERLLFLSFFLLFFFGKVHQGCFLSFPKRAKAPLLYELPWEPSSIGHLRLGCSWGFSKETEGEEGKGKKKRAYTHNYRKSNDWFSRQLKLEEEISISDLYLYGFFNLSCMYYKAILVVRIQKTSNMHHHVLFTVLWTINIFYNLVKK